MPRTVVPPVRARGGAVAGTGDGLPERLVKYVPAETLAFFLPVSAGLHGHRALLVVVLATGLIGTVGYLWLAAARLDAERRPLPFFYPLAGVAFLAWALGTDPDVAGLVGAGRLTAGVVLGVAVFLVPLADEVLTRLARR